MQCWICDSEDETKVKHRQFDLYVNGSEGVILCHDCEMMIVQHLRNIKSISTKVKNKDL